ncbi:MAG: VCBS repeat-containing protein [Planctomycetaceae bacterium]|nr:VCBS repeat-containing protein [Planctomycetaceae bacterium]
MNVRRLRSAHQRTLPNAGALISEFLERRDLLAAAAIELTPNEQLLLELINRARANPSAEAARYGIDLNQGLAAGTISTTPKQPLAPNQILIGVAGAHSQDMLDRDYFAHTAPPPGHPGGAAYNPNSPPAGSVTFDQRITDAGYNWQYVGENIAWGGITPSSAPLDQIASVYSRHEGLFLSPGHRTNILDNSFRELGPGVRYGLFTNPNNGTTYNAIMVSEEFGNPWGSGFITGVVFQDGRNGLAADDFYTIGEQVTSGTVTAVSSTGQTYSINLGTSGGYALQVPNGTYTVTAMGGAVGSTFVVTNVVVANSRNVKVDFDTSNAPTPVGTDSIVGRLSDGRVWIAVSNGTSFTNQVWTTWPAGINWQNMQVGDFTGDGKDDIAARDNEGDWWVWTAGASNFTAAEWGGRWSTAVTWNDVQTGDFNGDGRMDIVGRAQSGAWYLAESTGSTFNIRSIGGWSTNVTWTDVNTGDFNGDGKTDIVGRASTGSWVILQSSPSASSFANVSAGAWSTAVTWHDVRVGDFDNDGRDDVIGRASNGSWYVAFSTGSGFVNKLAGAWSTAVTWHDARIGDFNGDGRMDIAARSSNGTWYVLQPTGGTGTGTTFTTYYAGAWSTTVTWLNVVAGDFDGDGKTDIAGRASNGAWYVSRSTGSGFVNQLWGSWSPSVTWLDVQSIGVT